MKVINGTVNVFKGNSIAVVEYDSSGCRWEEDEDFKAWCGDEYNNRINVIFNAFMHSFNENSKGLKIDTDNSNASIKLPFKLTNFERNQSMTGMWGQGKISVTGSLSIIDLSTNTEVCTIKIDGYGDGKDFNHTDGMAKML